MGLGSEGCIKEVLIDTKIEGFEARADPRKSSETGISRSAGVKESSSDHTDIAEAP